jgi:diguanylate cyclase (GGDEF)-like protein/PAS domain S-box-containing protein
VPLIDEHGTVTGYFGVDKDITARKHDEYQLQLFEKVFESALEGITITDPEGAILAVNRAFTDITGYTAEEAVGENPRILKSDRHPASFYAAMWEALVQEGRWEGEIWNRRKNGEAYPEWLSISAIRDEDGHTSHYVAVFHDITEIKEKEERIQYQAYHDGLTGLPNRVLLKDRMRVAMLHAERHRRRMAVLFLDLDNFKTINDSLGHALGDRLLVAVAARVSGLVRTGDTVSRLGGDEFVVLMDGLEDEHEPVHLAQRVIEAMEQPFVLDGHELYITPSLGITVFPEDGDDPDTLIRNADLAMYQAKEQGRNRYRLFTAQMNERAQTRLALEKDIRKGLAEQEFFLHYQPRLDIAGDTVLGMEALARWQRNGETVSPAEFIPVCEETGLILPLGEQLLDLACSQVRECLAGDMRVSVNFSARQFQRADLVPQVERTLARHRMPPTALEMEITESVLLADLADTTRKLHELHDMGVRIAIDDFGTGYSSLAYLKHFPIDVLKIDRSFVIGLARNQGDTGIIRTITQLAANFHMRVVAEGVETAEQLDVLRGMHCHEIQGYYFSRPLPLEELRAFLAERE